MLTDYKFSDQLDCVLCQVGLMNDFKEETTNCKNGRGRKICPITFSELRADNTIKVSNTLYSTNGLLNLIKMQRWYPEVDEFNKKYWFDASLLLELKNPTTNVHFTKREACVICSLLLKKLPYFNEE